MLEIVIDWLQFTTKETNPLNVIITLLRLDVKDFVELKKGKMGYKRQWHSDNIFILFDGNQKLGEEMGTHVIITGKGCRIYENNNSLTDLIDRVNEYNCKVTRIDLAIDDREGNVIVLDKILEDVREGNTISKWKNSLELTQRELRTGKINGQTINLGSRSSEVFLRIYNKSMQLQEKGNWTRMEIEVKGKKATQLQKIISKEPIGPITKKLINNYIRIVEPGKDKNRSRWKTKSYWEKIINTTEKLSLSKKAEERTLKEMEDWIERQVSATLATIVHAHGGSVDFIYDQIKDGTKKMKSKHRSIVEKEMK